MHQPKREAQKLECCWCGQEYDPLDSTASDPLRHYLCSDKCEKEWRESEDPE